MSLCCGQARRSPLCDAGFLQLRCAACRLLESYVAEARKHGVRAHQVVLWVRRKLGPHISVWRKRSDGSFGCATPCVLCQRELKRYDLRVYCSQDTGWFVGRLTEEGAPQAQLTTAQRRLFAIGNHQILDLRLRKFNARFGLGGAGEEPDQACRKG